MSRTGFFLLVLAPVVLLGCQTPVTDGVSYTFVEQWGQRGDSPGEFREPVGIVISGDEIFVSDAGNNRIQVFDLDGGFLRTFASEGDSLGQLSRPMHLGIRGDTLYVAEYVNDRVQLFTLQGRALSSIGSAGEGPVQFDAPTSATWDSAGRMYVADFYNQRIQVIGEDGNLIQQLGTTGQDGPDPGQFTYPTAVATYPTGGFVVADAYNHRIQSFAEDGTFNWMLPQNENWADTTQGRFNVATSVAVGPDEAIFVADFYNHRIQVISKAGQLLDGFGTQGSAPGEFERPIDMAFDAAGNLYVVDFGNDRIQKFRAGP
jgi:sugar lactone lactonase YvrE